MGSGKIQLKFKRVLTIWGWRTKHRANIVGGNGKDMLVTPANQSYWNAEDLENALYKSYLVLKEKYDK